MFDGSAEQPGAMLGGAGHTGTGDGAHSGVPGAGVQPNPAHAALPAAAPVGIPSPAVARQPPVATPWTCPDPATLPPRQVLYAGHYSRGLVSTTIAPSGVGKTQRTITDAVEMVLGEALTGGKPSDKLTVWYINLENDREELDRRIAATLLHYGKRPEDLGGRLHVSSADDPPLIIAETIREGAVVDHKMCEALVNEIVLKGIDVLIIDPWVSAHQVSENDNNAVDKAVKALASVARNCKCAIEIVHHARKGNGNETTLDDGRGASALIAAVRSARVLNRMTEKEAKECGIAKPERASYVRVNIVKNNLAKLSDCPQWFRMVPHNLPNGDVVGVVEGWKWPATAALSAIDDEEMIFNIQEIVRGNPDLSPSPLAKSNYLGLHIGRLAGMDKIATQPSLVPKMNKLIKTLIDEGWLKLERRKGKGRLERSFVVVGKPVIPINL